MAVTLRGRLLLMIRPMNWWAHGEDHLGAHRSPQLGSAAGIDVMTQTIDHGTLLGLEWLMYTTMKAVCPSC